MTVLTWRRVSTGWLVMCSVFAAAEAASFPAFAKVPPSLPSSSFTSAREAQRHETYVSCLAAPAITSSRRRLAQDQQIASAFFWYFIYLGTNENIGHSLQH